MADPPVSGLATVTPSGNIPDNYQRLRTPSDIPTVRPLQVVPSPTSGAAARGLERLGQGLSQAGQFFGQVAADNAFNEYQEGVNKILRGDPNKINADGTPDVGYLGTKGQTAMEQRAATVKAMDDLRNDLRGKLYTPAQQATFDGYARRFKSFADQSVGTHADRETNQWYGQVNKKSESLALHHASANADNPVELANAYNELLAARTKQAQLAGGGPELLREAEVSSRRDILTAQVLAIGVTDPARAIRILEKNREVAGPQYDNLYNGLRGRANQQVGRETADYRLAEGRPPPGGDSAAAMLRHFEGFKSEAYWDVNHHRVGYGSDTITRADGKVVKTTEGAQVTQEDAERDLQRRVALYQNDIKSRIGAEQWAGLTPQAQASLTSVAYNYGKLPDSVVAAAKTGNLQAIANAVRALASDNGGVNRRRRLAEATNIAPVVGPDGKPVQATEVQLLEEGLKDPTLQDPQAYAAYATRVRQAYAVQQNTEVRQKAAFNQRVDDSKAEALNTGTTTNPIPQSEFERYYGTAEGPARYETYASAIRYGADYKALQSMSDLDQDRFLATRERALVPGKAGYAADLKHLDELRKTVALMHKERRDDPAGAVSRMPAVQDALATYDEKVPGSFALVAKARLEAQEQLGIEEEYRSPITKAEALRVMQPLLRALPGQEAETVQRIWGQFQTMFGAGAPRAMAYALRAVTFHGENQVEAARVLGSLAAKNSVTAQDRRALRDQQEAEAMARAAQGRPPTPEPWMSLGAEMNLPPEPLPEPSSPGKAYPTPNAEAIKTLKRDPQTADQFDAVFGPGAAKRLFEKYPDFFGQPTKAK